MAPWARTVAAALPSRWAFEGLLLLEADGRPAPAPAVLPAPVDDLAEPYFPAETERMGVEADATALGATAVGLAAAAALIATGSRPGA
jgi:hypothetical protein